jgi:tRNA threonylcarbamoyl adenosine modification protein YeaZ
MPVLSLDSSSGYSSVCIVGNDYKILAENSLGPHENHSIIIFKQIDEVLSKLNFTLKDLTGIAVSLGPGSFTGVRVSLSIAKALAFCLGLNILGVGSLYACAFSFLNRCNLKYVVVVKDFVKDRFYFSVFILKDFGLEEYKQLAAATIEEIYFMVKSLDGAPLIVYCGNNDDNLKYGITTIKKDIDIKIFDFLKVSYYAGIIALKTFSKYSNKTDIKYIEELSPYYVYSGGAF